MRWEHNIGGCLSSKSMRNVIDFGIRNVPALNNGGKATPEDWGAPSLQFQRSTNRHYSFDWPSLLITLA
jgi:hypothetical protein